MTLAKKILASTVLTVAFTGCAQIGGLQPQKNETLSNGVMSANLVVADKKAALQFSRDNVIAETVPCEMAAQRLAIMYVRATNVFDVNSNRGFALFEQQRKILRDNVDIMDADVRLMKQAKKQLCDKNGFKSPQADEDAADDLRIKYDYSLERILAKAGVFKV